MTSEESCRAYLRSVTSVTEQVSLPPVVALRELIARGWRESRTLFTAGNGGSSTVAEHLALGMSLNVFRETGKGAPAFCLSSSGTFATAAANDFGRDAMFAAQLRALAKRDDLLVVISASGKSQNLVNVVATARELGVRTGAIVGQLGPVSALADLVVNVNVMSSAVAEDVTIMLLHWLYCSFMGERA